MSEFRVCDEGMESLWRGLTRDLNDASLEFVPSHFVKRVAHLFFREGFNGCHDIFEVSAVPTGRAGVGRLVVRFSGAFYCYATRAAKDRYGLISH